MLAHLRELDQTSQSCQTTNRQSPKWTEMTPSVQVSILWSRAEGFDNHPGTWFEPDNFVPITNKKQLNDRGREKHDKSSKSSNTVKPRSVSPHCFLFKKSLAHPVKHHPANKFTKEPQKWLEWGTAVGPRKNWNHKYHFSRQGVLDIVISDNGPQVACEKFSNFANKRGFEHWPGSPGVHCSKLLKTVQAWKVTR